MSLQYQVQWLMLVVQDLHLVSSAIDESDARLVRLSTQQLAHVTVKRACEDDPPRFLINQLRGAREMVDGVELRLKVRHSTATHAWT